MEEKKFSIENFVEDSVPSIEENDRDFRSISGEIDKRINSAGGSRKNIISDRIRGKISRIKSSIAPDLESLKADMGLINGDKTHFETERLSLKAEELPLRSSGVETEDSVFSEDDDFFSDDSVYDSGDEVGTQKDSAHIDVKGKNDDVWTGSVLDRLRAFGYINVADNSGEASGIEPDVEALENRKQRTVEQRFRTSERAETVNLATDAPKNNGSMDNAFSGETRALQQRNTASVTRDSVRISYGRNNRISAEKNKLRPPAAKKEAPAVISRTEDNDTDSGKVVGYEKISVIPKRKYTYPSVDLIRPASTEVMRSSCDPASFEEETNYKAAKLVETLKSFGIGITITGVTRGPSVTRFEFQPEIGVRISKIVALTDDIALNLAASAVRMEAPIPGKSAIGIEIPNETVDTVYLYDVINSSEYRNAKSKISFALGKDIEGRIVVADLAKMPHVLIAGSTGSGKSVCINTIISGILYGASPDEVKFIMIDPKVVELGMYNNIPHLLIPVVTEPKKAASALAWAVGEVERRYHLFAEHNVRDIFSFNKGVKERGDMSGLETMPQIVIIIDELADLMMVASQDVEKSIIRLAQKARAAGVHLVIATQRPSVDVITGLIKANIPSRIAFAVASSFDSRTILDSIGAEKLLGRGDMLYHPIGIAKSKRVQGAFISDAEVERITEFVKNSYGAPQFDESIKASIDRAAEELQKGAGSKSQKNETTAENTPDGDEELVMVAAELGLKQKQLSASNLQRKLKLGYSRAARIIDKLEEIGFLSASDGSKPRQVLMTEAEWIELNTPVDDELEDDVDYDADSSLYDD